MSRGKILWNAWALVDMLGTGIDKGGRTNNFHNVSLQGGGGGGGILKKKKKK